MDITIFPRQLSGTIRAISSKSQAHRLLICAAFSNAETTLICTDTNEDIEATADCLRSLGADICRKDGIYSVTPITDLPHSADLHCRESGSTLRFMLPIIGALGVAGTFHLKGRLSQRPLSPLWEEMERMGCQLSRPNESTVLCQGQLSPGTYNIAGNISSQFITGLLFAFALMDGASDLHISGKLESLPYISMTQAAMRLFGVNTEDFQVNGVGHFKTPGTVTVEGDWSNGAFFLSAKALGSSLTVTNLDIHSSQGDRTIADILANIDNCPTVDAADIPDLVPILAVVGGAKKGISFTNIRRLRLKESDRVATVCAMLEKLGAHTEATENTLTVSPAPYSGCTIDAAGDHRIAMAAAIAATVASGLITILGAQCVAKSYPAFWNDYKKLGGCYEQHLR